MDNQLEICKRTRKIAANTLLITLKKLLSSNKPISEVLFRNTWLLELRKHKEIFPNGWYIPPVYGIGVLFSTDENSARTDYTTLRKKKYWPRNDVFLDKQKGIIMAYASPVHKEGTIGDFGLDIYLGKNEKIRNHLKKIYYVVHLLFEEMKLNMRLSDVYKLGYKIFEKNKLVNEGWLSQTDPTGINIGHSITFLNQEEIELIKNKNWTDVCEFISKKRKFINSIEKTIIKPGFATTLEPRIKEINSKGPTMYCHTIALFKENGEKELLTDFDEIFKFVGIDYMI